MVFGVSSPLGGPGTGLFGEAALIPSPKNYSRNVRHVGHLVWLHYLLMEDPAKKLAKNLRKWRGDQSLRDYARKLGVSKSTLGGLENVNQNTTLRTLTTLAKALRCDICDLFK